ncbi:MAG: trypsin-like peptidase domain-containing protein [Bacteroidales bacterium]|nr:trypsin-like peptidase domain-containing protein [Bacteroidales bacterium]
MKKLNCLVFYENYLFSEDKKITKSNFKPDNLKKDAILAEITNESVLGTATIIYYDNERIAFLTCNHIIDFPDTIFSFYYNNSSKEKYISSVSIKAKQMNHIRGIPEGEELEILATDKKNDIAFLGKKITQTNENIPFFNYPCGESNNLEWGSFVYIIGYPMGFQMITRGIVSNPDKIKSGSFLIDAVFNRGFSGGLVLGIKDGVPNFELVGMAKSVPYKKENILIPETVNENFEYDSYSPFKGNIYVKSKKNISYGITNSVTIETIKKFFKENKKKLESKGYNLESFFN